MNHKLWQSGGLLTLLAMSFISSGLRAEAWTPPDYANTKPSFQEEFLSTKLDTSKWNTTYPWDARTNAGNGELQYYVDNAFTFANSAVKIKAEKKPTEGYQYTSGILTTYGKFTQQYGYFEMRAKLPKGQGFWPAFWMLPSDLSWPPEIDVMEALGHQPTTVYMTSHYLNSAQNYDSLGSYYTSIGDYTKDYHTFGVDWRPSSITWYVDGRQRYKVTTNIPSKKMYLIANLAVGGNWPGSPNATTPFPSYLVIDYIRAYPYNGK